MVETTLYRNKVFIEEIGAPMNLEVVKRGSQKVFIRAWNTKLLIRSEVELHLKQACSYLMYYGNDFDRFIRETVVFHPHGKISLVDMHKIKYIAAIQSSYQASAESFNKYISRNIQEEDFEDEDDE
jgi:hypothetical protein